MSYVDEKYLSIQYVSQLNDHYQLVDIYTTRENPGYYHIINSLSVYNNSTSYGTGRDMRCYFYLYIKGARIAFDNTLYGKYSTGTNANNNILYLKPNNTFTAINKTNPMFLSSSGNKNGITVLIYDSSGNTDGRGLHITANLKLISKKRLKGRRIGR